MPTAGNRLFPATGSSRKASPPVRETNPSASQPVRPDTGPVRLLLAIQPPLWAELLAGALAGEKGLSVIGIAAGEDDLAAHADGDDGTVILFDYEAMGPGSEGIIARLRRLNPSHRMLVLARRSGDETTVAVLRAGAAGLVGKHQGYAILLAAIHSVAKGEIWANRHVTAQVIAQMASRGQRDSGGSASLTRREWDVVDAIRQGASNKEIAVGLGISEKTIKTHLTNIFVKTGIHSRFALALWAQQELQPKS